MRFDRSSFLWLPLATVLVACSGSFGAGDGSDAGAGGTDATDDNPAVEGLGTEAGGGHDGAAVDAGHQDATAAEAGAAETGATGAEGGGDVPEAGGDEGPPPGCSTGDIECSGTCVPSDVHNCGTCGHDCTNLAHVAGTTSCTTAGACSFPASSCAAGWADCDGKPDDGCETDITTKSTCGSCTNACPANDPVCAAGTCVSGCPTTTPTLCSGACVDTTSNASNCNGCGLACPNNVTNAQPTCASSQCSFACNSGFTGCPTAGPTECVDEQHDANNCGACNKACPGPTSGTGTPACAAGACTLDCNAGLMACPTASPTECADTTTDLSNCGSCGDVCSTAPPNAHPTCATSKCGFACNTGFLLCNSSTCIPGPDTVNGAFVSPMHGSGATCTSTQPCSTIATAIATGKATIYLDAGSYEELVTLPATGLTVHGGWTYSAGGSVPWTNCGGTNATSILSAPAGQTSAVTAGTTGTWTLDTLTIENNTTATAGQSLYGVFVASGSLTLTNVDIQVAAGGAGASGTIGGIGAAAPTPPCTQDPNCASTATPGTPGQGTYGASGFIPGNGGLAQAGYPGCSGTAGKPGSSATAGRCETDECNGYSVSGASGNAGCGGGGGAGGGGGFGGGASIGVFSGGGTVGLSSVTIQTGTGGHGGSAGAGGPGAQGSAGTAGANGTYNSCTTSEGKCTSTGPFPLTGGAAGGTGVTGGTGGTGGGGAGGDSFCYATPSGGTTAAGVTCNHGSGGLPGSGGNQGAPGNAG
ncbi:MAG TPA: hypothetical protein VGL81_18695 [Polyangiaceae bacterium]